MNGLPIFEQNADLQSAINSMIKSSCIVDFGVILSVEAKGVVKVGISVARNSKTVRTLTCTLISPVSKAFSFDLEAQEGDKVLVVYPRTFDPAMFDLNNDDVIKNENAHGYDSASGLAILYNQYRENDYKRCISVDKYGIITAKFDDNSITVDLSDSGHKIVLSDSNGCKVETTSTSLKINNKLEIKK